MEILTAPELDEAALAEAQANVNAIDQTLIHSFFIKYFKQKSHTVKYCFVMGLTFIKQFTAFDEFAMKTF